MFGRRLGRRLGRRGGLLFGDCRDRDGRGDGHRGGHHLLMFFDAVLRDDVDAIVLLVLSCRGPGKIVTADLGIQLAAEVNSRAVRGLKNIPRHSRRRTRRAGHRPYPEAQLPR